MKPKLFILLSCSLILTALKSRAQTPVPFDSPRWTIKAGWKIDPNFSVN